MSNQDSIFAAEERLIDLVLRRVDSKFDAPGEEGGKEVAFAVNIIAGISQSRSAREVNSAHASLQFSKGVRAQQEGQAANTEAQAKFMEAQARFVEAQNESRRVALDELLATADEDVVCCGGECEDDDDDFEVEPDALDFDESGGIKSEQ